MATVKKNRLDVELVARQLTPSREKAVALIMAGEVLVDGQVAHKADKKVTAASNIEIKERYPFVSRGAFKAKKAFEAFDIDPAGMKALDIGISTGGFSDYMLQQGAEIVTGVDVNIQQVDFNLTKNPRLRLVKKNARYLEKEDVGYEPDIITMDLSFISITKILPQLAAFPGARVVSLIKPQFESEKYKIGKGGIVRDHSQRIQILLDLKHKIEALNFSVVGFTDSGIRGRKGNQEYFFLIEYGVKAPFDDKIIIDGTEV